MIDCVKHGLKRFEYVVGNIQRMRDSVYSVVGYLAARARYYG